MENSMPVRVVALIRLALIVVFTFVLADVSQAQSGGKLRRAKNAVRKKAPQAQSKKAKLPKREERHESKPDRDDHDADHDDRDRPRRDRHRDDHQNSGFRLFFHSSPAVTYAPPVIVHQQIVPPQPVFESVVVEPFPVEIVESSAVVISHPAGIGTDWFDDKTSKFWAVVGSDFDGITAGGLGLLLQAPGSLGLDSSVMMLRESSFDYRDHLWVGDVNVVYEVLSRGDIRGRVGLGINWLSDSWGAESGFNLTAGVDMRLTHRLTLSAEGDFGNLGEVDFLHGRVNLARRFETCELMLGVDHYNFGGAEVNSFFTGIQLRF